MNFTKTPDTTGLAFSPFELRPGTTAQVDYSYVEREETTWNSDLPLDISVSGMTWAPAVEADWPIADDGIEITTSGVWSTVSLDAIGHGVIDLAINYKIDVSENITAISAVSDTAAVYYDDWYTDEDGVTVPMTVLPLTLPTTYGTYKPEDFTVTFTQAERGVTVLGGDKWTSSSVGTLKMVDYQDDFSRSWNLFRKGVTEIRVPMSCNIEPIIRYDLTDGVKSGKYVEVDLQDWSPHRYDVRGILWHRDKLYVLTGDGMFAFDRWSNFAEAEASYPSVTGYDLTYAVEDKFLVTEGTALKVYKVLHDYQHYDRATEVLRFREANPNFKVGD